MVRTKKLTDDEFLEVMRNNAYSDNHLTSLVFKTGLSRGTVHKMLLSLLKENKLVVVKRIGNTNLYKVV